MYMLLTLTPHFLLTALNMSSNSDTQQPSSWSTHPKKPDQTSMLKCPVEGSSITQNCTFSQPLYATPEIIKMETHTPNACQSHGSSST